jgi:hypothetical protein
MVQPWACQNTGAGAFLLEVEQVHLAAELAVVALLGLFELVQIGVELFLLGEGGAVDAGQHRDCCCRRANRRPATFCSLKALPILPVEVMCGPRQRSNQSPWR